MIGLCGCNGFGNLGIVACGVNNFSVCLGVCITSSICLFPCLSLVGCLTGWLNISFGFCIISWVVVCLGIEITFSINLTLGVSATGELIILPVIPLFNDKGSTVWVSPVKPPLYIDWSVPVPPTIVGAVNAETIGKKWVVDFGVGLN